MLFVKEGNSCVLLRVQVWERRAMTQEDKARVGRAGVGHSESRSFVSWNECGALLWFVPSILGYVEGSELRDNTMAPSWSFLCFLELVTDLSERSSYNSFL
jgi:hypothetical protein